MLSSLSSLPRSVTLSESPVGRAGAAVAESIAGLEATARRHEAAPQRPAPDGGWYADVTRACNFAARLVTRACGLAERWDHARASAAAAGAESPDLLAKAQQMRRMAVELDKLQIADRHLLRSRVSEAGAWCSEASEELMKHMAAQDDAVIRVVTHAATQLEALGDDEMELEEPPPPPPPRAAHDSDDEQDDSDLDEEGKKVRRLLGRQENGTLAVMGLGGSDPNLVGHGSVDHPLNTPETHSFTRARSPDAVFNASSNTV